MDKDDSLAEVPEKENGMKEISPMRSPAASALYVPIHNKSYVWYVRIFGLNRYALSLLVVLSFLSVKS